MSGLHLHTSNRLETLAEALAGVLGTPLSSPLAIETVTVQSKGMERWLSLQLAQQRGIWANYRFPFPNAVIRELLGAVLGDAEESPLLIPEHLSLRLMTLLPGLLNRPAFAPLRPYLADRPDDDLRLWQLCCRIADAFDQYLVYRHDLIRDWEQGMDHKLGPHEAWQRELWRAVTDTTSHQSHRAQLVERFRAQIASEPLLVGARLPERITLFGVATLPPLHLEVLDAVSRYTSVHLFLLNPCAGYWYELQTPGEEAHLLRRAATRGLGPEELWLEAGHPLLASLGRSGRNLFRRLNELDKFDAPHFVVPTGASLLTRLQRELLESGDTAWPPLQKTPLAADDASLQVHSCHGPLREIEALHDLLLTAFLELENLAPREVLVMAPDIEVYAPLIEAVFGAAHDGRPLLPYTIADRGRTSESSLLTAFERLGAVVGWRFGAAEILDLLELAPVARRFGMSEGDLEIVRDWVESVRIRWGLDAAFRREQGLPEDDAFTWQAGLDRLLLGAALPEGERLFSGILPSDGSASHLPLLGRLIEFVEQLGAWAATTHRQLSFVEWSAAFDATALTLLDAGEDEGEMNRLRRLCASLADEARVAGFDAPVSFSVALARLTELLGERSTHGFLSGPITFCTLQPMRSVPFRVVALLGMNDGDFPRQSRPPGFDLMPLDPRPCDPARRDEDRYLFLEALLSARDRLLVTWQGEDPRDGSTAPPSVVIGELLDALEQSFLPDDGATLRQRLVTRHRLQPFSPDYFRADQRLRSHQPLWYAGVEASAARGPGVLPRPFLATPLPPPTPALMTVELPQLERFWRNPAEYFSRHRLQLRLASVDAGLEEREPFLLDPLDNYQLGQDLTRRLLNGQDAAGQHELCRASGRLPTGPIGVSAWRELEGEVQVFAASLRPHFSAGTQPLLLDLECAGVRLIGSLDDYGPQGALCWRYAKLKAKDRLGAWLRHLAGCAAGAQCPTLLVGRDGTLRYAPLLKAEAVARLGELLELYQRGWSEPLRFFPASALAYAAQLRKTGEHAAALAAAQREWFSAEFHHGEDGDPHYRLCFEPEPFNDDFVRLAQTVCLPLLAAEDQP